MNKLIATIALSALLTACGTAVTAEPTNETATSTTRTPRITDDSGRPDITFDPCLDIPDDIMNAAGYNAAKKELADYPMGDYTFLGCIYSKSDYVPGVRTGFSLSILSGNVTVEEELAKNGQFATEVSVNGRRALLEIDTSSPDECKYVLHAEFGLVMFSRLYDTDFPGPAPQSEWCAGMEALVSTLEPYIPL